MRSHVLILIAALTFVLATDDAEGQTTKRKRVKRPSAEAEAEQTLAPGITVDQPVRKRKRRLASSYAWRVGYTIWQESMEISNASASTNMIAQLQGLTGSLVYNRGTGIRNLRWTFTGDAGAGFLKGKGYDAQVPDEFSNQPWFSVGGSVGATYRASEVSSVALVVPAAYRYIMWKLDEGSSTKTESATSVSLGYGFQYMNNFGKSATLILGFTHQHMWDATQWNIGGQWTL